MEKIDLYEKRNFGENFNLTFIFLKQNYGAMCKMLCYFIPLFLLVAYFVKNELGSLYADLMGVYSPLTNSMESLLGTLLSYVSLFIINVFTICYVVEYVESEDVKVSPSAVWNRLKNNIAPLVVSAILYGMAVGLGVMLCFVPGIIIAVYWMFFSYAYVAHEPGITDCLTSSYYLVKESWWVTFGYVIVFGLISFLLQQIFALPSYMYFVGEMLDIPFFTGELYLFVTSCISQLGILFITPLAYVAYGVMYYSLRTDVYGIDVDAAIDKLKLGEKEEDL
jgi:hypothetical protein